MNTTDLQYATEIPYGSTIWTKSISTRHQELSPGDAGFMDWMESRLFGLVESSKRLAHFAVGEPVYGLGDFGFDLGDACL